MRRLTYVLAFVAILAVAISGSPSFAAGKNWTGRIGVVEVFNPFYQAPEHVAFLASGCSNDITSGVNAAVFNVRAYRGRHITISGTKNDAGSQSSNIDVQLGTACDAAPGATANTLHRVGYAAPTLSFYIPSNAVYLVLFSADFTQLDTTYSADAV